MASQLEQEQGHGNVLGGGDVAKESPHLLPDASLDDRDRLVSHELVQSPPLLADQILLVRG